MADYDPYTPWQAQEQYPDAAQAMRLMGERGVLTDQDMARIAMQRQGGGIRQRQGDLARLLQRLRLMMGMGGGVQGVQPPFVSPGSGYGKLME